MKATARDLRYRMKEVLKALDKGEKVTVFYHGRLKGTIIPASGVSTLRVKDHPFLWHLCGRVGVCIRPDGRTQEGPLRCYLIRISSFGSRLTVFSFYRFTQAFPPPSRFSG